MGARDWWDVPPDQLWGIRATVPWIQLESKYTSMEFVATGPFGVRARVEVQFEADTEPLGNPFTAGVAAAIRPLGAGEETFCVTIVTPRTDDPRLAMRAVLFDDETDERRAESDWVTLVLPAARSGDYDFFDA
ncbi:hypothetical protein [Lentzea sp. E54]|uniref:hypothetical protein n=1 Tax=Lentzea xerophila TaxID=3435883 RepID=UPI003DA2B4F9